MQKEGIGIFTQHLTTDIHEAAIATFAGYNVRFLTAEAQYAIQDPGDLQELLKDFKAGIQSISDAKKLLDVYDTLRQRIPAAPIAEPTDCARVTFERTGKEFKTADFGLSACLIDLGFYYLGCRRISDKHLFIFDQASEIAKASADYKQGRTRCDPRTLTQAYFKLTGEVRSSYKKAKEAA